MKKLLLPAAAAACLVFSSAPAQSQWVNVTGGINYPTTIQTNGVEIVRRVGIGNATPNGWLQFYNDHESRKVVLFESANNDQEYYGLGTNPDVFRFQIPGPTRAYRFFRANSSTSSTEIFTIDGTGNVGINNPTPNAPLQLDNSTQNRKIVLFEAANNDHQFHGLGIGNQSFRFQIPGSDRAYRFFRADGTTASTEVFTIQGGGNVGVGINNPIVKFQVQGGNVAQTSSGNLGDANGKWSALGQPPAAFPTGGEYFGLFRNWAQQSFITGLLDNGTKKDGVISWGDATANNSNPSDPSTTTRLRIGFIKGSGTGTANPAEFSEKATILANGYIGIGIITPTYRVQLPNNANVSGRGLANAWFTYSSGRWKENVKTLEKASEKIMALRGVEYDWKKESGGGHAIGFIAEEAGKVLPDAVDWETDGKGASGMNYDAVIPVLVEAFKELSKEKDAKIKALEDRLAQLEKSPSGARMGALGAGLSAETSALLRQNRPNPFGEKTIIEYELPEATKQAALFIYNVQGEQLKRFDLSGKGSKSVELDGNTLPAGLYLYSLLVDGKVVDTKQMVLTK